MSTNTQPAKETSRKGTKPAFTAYHVQDSVEEGGQARWTKIGVYFAHEDGQGGTVKLDSLPIHFDGRIVLRAPKAEYGRGAYETSHRSSPCNAAGEWSPAAPPAGHAQ